MSSSNDSSCNSQKYKEEHKYCPKCGCISFESTTIGFLGAKDMNKTTCCSCGWKGVTHDRVAYRIENACQCKYCLKESLKI